MNPNRKLLFDKTAMAQPTPQEAPDANPWQVLIVDDDPSVHELTRLLLGKLRFKERPLAFFSAFSADEAIEQLQQLPHVALILLDVVMERDDSGLRLVRHVRDELQNHAVRIMLRTGQPGEAPELTVVNDYGINDYKTKTELTAQRLQSAVISSLRAFDDILSIRGLGLQRVMAVPNNYGRSQSMRSFAASALLQSSQFIFDRAGASMAFARRHPEGGPGAFEFVLGSGMLENVEARPPEDDALAESVRAGLAKAFREGRTLHRDDSVTLFLPDAWGRDAAIYIPWPPTQQTVDLQLLQLFVDRLTVGFSNASLIEDLERRVRERTADLIAHNAQLVDQAMHDPHTVAVSHRFFLDALDRELARSERMGGCFVVIAIDFHDLPRIMDAHGAEMGDAVLKEFAQLARSDLRRQDVLGRLDASRFRLLLPDTDAAAAQIVAKRLCESVDGFDFITSGGEKLRLSLSLGIAPNRPGESTESLLRRSEQALARTRVLGLGSVIFVSEP